MKSIKDILIKFVVQKEGVFIEGFPISKKYISILFLVSLVGIILCAAVIICEYAINDYFLYEFLIVVAIFLMPSVAAIILILFNVKINKKKRLIASDEKGIYVDVVPYKVYPNNGTRERFRLQTIFMYGNKQITLTSKEYKGNKSALKPNVSTQIFYSPTYGDAIIYFNKTIK